MFLSWSQLPQVSERTSMSCENVFWIFRSLQPNVGLWSPSMFWYPIEKSRGVLNIMPLVIRICIGGARINF